MGARASPQLHIVPPPTEPHSLASARSAGASIVAQIAQIQIAARDNETQLALADEALRATHACNSRLFDAHASLQTQLVEAQQTIRELEQQREMSESARRQSEARFDELQVEHSHTLRLLDENRSRVRSLDGQLATVDAELHAAQNGNDALREVRCRLENEIKQLRKDQAQINSQMLNERDAASTASAEATVRAKSDLEALRLELGSRLRAEQESTVSLSEEIRAIRGEAQHLRSANESLRDGRSRLEEELQQLRSDCDSMKLAIQHKDEIHRADIFRIESKCAADASQAALETERLRQEMANERQLAQQALTEAKEETARARLEALHAREDALHWQKRSGP